MKKFNLNDVRIIKKDGTKEKFNPEKILIATQKSANRIGKTWTENEKENLILYVLQKIKESGETEFHIDAIHSMVEYALDRVNPRVANQYRNYRNWKQKSMKIFDEMEQVENTIRYIGDRSNANKDASLVATKRSLLYGEYSTRRYELSFLTEEEKQAAKDGYIYIHDKDSRLDTFNCFRRDTKFITKNGVKSFYDFNDGDKTVVLSQNGVWRKAIIHKYGWQSLQKVTFTKGVHTSKKREVFCTQNHKWFLKNGIETTELKVGDILYSIPDKTQFNWDELSIENKKLWCKGFALGDGSISEQKSRQDYIIIRLCGNKSKYKDRFIDAGYSVTKPDSYNGDYLVSMFSVSSKGIPWLDLNYTNILYYVNGLLCADGNYTNSKNNVSEFRGISITGDLNDVIYDLLNMAGYFVSSYNDITGTETNYGIRTKRTINYQISSSQERTSSWRVEKIEKSCLNPKSEVWCLEVEEDHGFILEGGIPTGNCSLFNMTDVLNGGFQMGNMWYNEPGSLDTAFDVMGDIILGTAAQQYGCI